MGYKKRLVKERDCSWNFEKKCLRSSVGLKNEEVHGRAGIERELASGADKRALRWLRYAERINEYRMARRVLGRVPS